MQQHLLSCAPSTFLKEKVILSFKIWFLVAIKPVKYIQYFIHSDNVKYPGFINNAPIKLFVSFLSIPDKLYNALFNFKGSNQKHHYSIRNIDQLKNIPIPSEIQE